MTVRQMSEKYSVSTGEINHETSLLGLPEKIQDLFLHRNTGLTEWHYYHISKLVDRDDLEKKFLSLGVDDWGERSLKELEYRSNIQIDLARRIIDNDLTIRQTERQVKE